MIYPNPLRLLKTIDAQIRNTTVKCLAQAISEGELLKKSHLSSVAAKPKVQQGYRCGSCWEELRPI